MDTVSNCICELACDEEQASAVITVERAFFIVAIPFVRRS